ncbi:MAG TPA: VOC family protein [Candidatus Binataceae bacterium]|nr:VOC family protein [Candidatus Binataceae bacterium]
MFRIGREFHLLHVVTDLNEVDEWYDRVFAVRRFVRNYMKAAMRKASLVLIGDFVMEPAQPVQSLPGWEKSALGKFYTRYGQHFHSIAWYVDNLQETCGGLIESKVRLFDMVGKPVTEAGKGDAVWTHPQDTHAAFEFAVAPKFFIDPRLQPGWSMQFPRDQHPLGIERASHITMLFRDLSHARSVYQDALGGKLIHEQEIAGRKRSAFYAVGQDTVIEAVQPLSSSSPEGQGLERAGEGIFSVTFKTRDLNRAAAHLRANQLRIEPGEGELTINRHDAFGMTLSFTDRTIPNDPRPQ